MGGTRLVFRRQYVFQEINIYKDEPTKPQPTAGAGRLPSYARSELSSRPHVGPATVPPCLRHGQHGDLLRVATLACPGSQVVATLP